jgi:hypothetical protein
VHDEYDECYSNISHTPEYRDLEDLFATYCVCMCVANVCVQVWMGTSMIQVRCGVPALLLPFPRVPPSPHWWSSSRAARQGCFTTLPHTQLLSALNETLVKAQLSIEYALGTCGDFGGDVQGARLRSSLCLEQSRPGRHRIYGREQHGQAISYGYSRAYLIQEPCVRVSLIGEVFTVLMCM